MPGICGSTRWRSSSRRWPGHGRWRLNQAPCQRNSARRAECRRAETVKPEFAKQLRCPACTSDKSLSLHATESNEREVREGSLQCRVCHTRFALRRGVPELLYDPPQHILTEAPGLERFAEQMRLEGWGPELVPQLPNLEHGYG